MRLELHAAAETWVRVEGDGKYLYSGVMPPSSARLVEGAARIRVKVGNAGGIEILFNGKPVGSLGPAGQVRTVDFTPDGFKIVVPAPPAPAPTPDDGL